MGILRRGRYVKGKQIGKAPVVDVVSYISRATDLAKTSIMLRLPKHRGYAHIGTLRLRAG